MKQDTSKFIVLPFCVLLACSPVLAQDASKAPGKNAPPPKMTPAQKKQAVAAACEKEAESLKLKDDNLKAFMKGCLKD